VSAACTVPASSPNQSGHSQLQRGSENRIKEIPSNRGSTKVRSTKLLHVEQEKKIKEGEPAASWPDQSGRPTYVKVPAQRQRLPVNYEDCADNSEKNISTTSSSISSTAACYARGLAVAH
jgi:hypothetical protein